MNGNEKLVSAGISNLWTSYMNNSFAICINKYALNIIEDSNIRSIYESALQISENNVEQITEIFNTAIARDARVAEDGMNIMIANQLYEQPPQAANRKALFEHR